MRDRTITRLRIAKSTISPWAIFYVMTYFDWVFLVGWGVNKEKAVKTNHNIPLRSFTIMLFGTRCRFGPSLRAKRIFILARKLRRFPRKQIAKLLRGSSCPSFGFFLIYAIIFFLALLHPPLITLWLDNGGNNPIYDHYSDWTLKY